MTRQVMMTLSRIEALHLSQMTTQFLELLEATTDAHADDAVARLVPDAYSDDDDAAAEFRRLTESELLERRMSDARAVIELISPALPSMPVTQGDPVLLEDAVLHASGDEVDSLLRTLAAIRLVLATRLGVTESDGHDSDDPRFGIYDWLGYRLDALLSAIDDGPEEPDLTEE